MRNTYRGEAGAYCGSGQARRGRGLLFLFRGHFWWTRMSWERCVVCGDRGGGLRDAPRGVSEAERCARTFEKEQRQEFWKPYNKSSETPFCREKWRRGQRWVEGRQ
jgi:hypothetical protein